MTDKSHDEQVERWAKYVRDNPKAWKSKFKLFLDAQFVMMKRFYEKLAETEEGKKTILKLKNVK